MFFRWSYFLKIIRVLAHKNFVFRTLRKLSYSLDPSAFLRLHMSFIQLENLRKSYPDASGTANIVALQDIHLNIERGEFLSIIGPSGCGKSTLLHTIAGLTTPTSGTVRKLGKIMKAPGPDRAVMFQEYALYPWLTVADNIELGLKAKGLDAANRAKIVSHYIDLVQLSGFENNYPGELSGGMRQRVSIARCLACEPDVVLMDEPFSALDSLTRDVMQEEILKIREQTGQTFVLVTHSIDEAVFLSDRVVVMSRRPGRIKEIINIKLPHPRTLELRATSSTFMASREHLLRTLRAESDI